MEVESQQQIVGAELAELEVALQHSEVGLMAEEAEERPAIVAALEEVDLSLEAQAVAEVGRKAVVVAERTGFVVAVELCMDLERLDVAVAWHLDQARAYCQEQEHIDSKARLWM